jgi:hypothetical protein
MHHSPLSKVQQLAESLHLVMRQTKAQTVQSQLWVHSEPWQKTFELG